MRCEGATLETCGQDGTFQVQQQCPSACSDTLGCVVCVPGTGVCNGDVAHACNATGTGFTDTTCDPVEGSSCDAASGTCTGPCAPQNLGKSYIGCEYYPTVTGNDVDDTFQFAIAVSNASSAPATVTIDGGALTAPMTLTVAPGNVQTQYLPWVPSLKLCTDVPGQIECGTPQTTTDVLATRGAYHLRSTQPVTVYQFNPLDYSAGGGAQFSFTNDASLLIPVNAWSGNYVTVAYPSWTNPQATTFPSLLAITAARDGTHVTVTTRAPTPGSPTSPAFQTGTPTTTTLNAGDALELTTYAGDLTGSWIVADGPVQVIGGHYCTNIPQNVQYCDHVEESMFPVESLSTKYVIAPPVLPTPGFDHGKIEIVRIVAAAPDTQLTFDPPQPSAPTTLAQAGDMIELSNTNAAFHLTATHKIIVAQFMEGENAGGGSGDPAMALAVATDQYRSSYLFHAPTNYETNYVQVTAPLGDAITLDGAPLAATWDPIGSSGYGVARVVLAAGAGGNHVMTGAAPFGIQVYGYGQYTSYWYPGGLDLTDIPVN